MAVSLTRNLKLRKDSNLSADAAYNLERLDSLGALYQTNTSEAAVIRSQTSVTIEPNSSDIGGSGSGGVLNLGTANQPLETLVINAETAAFASGVSLSDEAVGGTKTLGLKYKSDLSGIIDLDDDRCLFIDLDSADRNLVIGADITFNQNLTFPTISGIAGQVLTTDGTGTLTWTSSAATNLDSLTDVTIAIPVSGESLVYNGSSWVNQSVGLTTSVVSWDNSDGSVKVINHGFNSRNILVQIVDPSNNYCTLDIDDVCRTSDNEITLTSSTAPSSSWSVFIIKL